MGMAVHWCAFVCVCPTHWVWRTKSDSRDTRYVSYCSVGCHCDHHSSYYFLRLQYQLVVGALLLQTHVLVLFPPFGTVGGVVVVAVGVLVVGAVDVNYAVVVVDAVTSSGSVVVVEFLLLAGEFATSGVLVVRLGALGFPAEPVAVVFLLLACSETAKVLEHKLWTKQPMSWEVVAAFPSWVTACSVHCASKETGSTWRMVEEQGDVELPPLLLLLTNDLMHVVADAAGGGSGIAALMTTDPLLELGH